MNWPAIGAIAELLGAAGVIASLLYLARQIRNSAAEGRRAAAEAVLTKMMTAFQRTSAHPQLADAFLRGSTDLTSLSPQEALQFSSLLHSFVRPYEEIVYARRAGAVEEWVWDNGERSILPLLTTPGALEWWAKRKTWYTPALQAHIANILPAEAMESLAGLEKSLKGKVFRAGVLVETSAPDPSTTEVP